jgi:hypothetical protein
MSKIDSKQLLAEIDALCQTQIIRISKQPLPISPKRPPAKPEGQIFTDPGADATPVWHADGKRKPSLSELDRMPLAKAYNRSRKPKF